MRYAVLPPDALKYVAKHYLVPTRFVMVLLVFSRAASRLLDDASRAQRRRSRPRTQRRRA